ncbi:CLUMA_CG010639, isoform A [Clunio marinus]|uniref:CLUMA_CG010639, isoform A n=1 Tax=Clunio marinus TaxID=568069 RepID=A0A1J1IAK2_9DIPT|nr:CLUMA_CG010639, isoform A [Clunio marinus]
MHLCPCLSILDVAGQSECLFTYIIIYLTIIASMNLEWIGMKNNNWAMKFVIEAKRNELTVNMFNVVTVKR